MLRQKLTHVLAEPLNTSGLPSGQGGAPPQPVVAIRALEHLSALLHSQGKPHCAEDIEPGIALILHLSRGDSPVDVPLPSAWSAEILHALAALIAGRGVAWSSNTETEDEIGTGELAEMLGVSPPTVMAMLDRGEISMRLTPGGHRRARRADVLQWRVRREIQRRSLRELVQMAERDESEGSSLPHPCNRIRMMSDDLIDGVATRY